MRQVISKKTENPKAIKEALLQFGQQFHKVVFLDSNLADNQNQRFSSYDAVLAVDAKKTLTTGENGAWEKLETFYKETQDWLFGYLSYDLKNDIENLQSTNYDGLNFPALSFFQPKKLFLLQGNVLEMHYLPEVANQVEADWQFLQKNVLEKHTKLPPPTIQSRLSKSDYLERVSALQEHIMRGDIYEANFCQEFYATQTVLNPLNCFRKLNEISRAPFSTFLRDDDKYLLSASPERYLKRQENMVISQPIKGTAHRSKNPKTDKALAESLMADPKELAENIMITDLVRNDLSKTANKNSVQVTELCGLYTFRQVHQLITTITAEVAAETSSVEVLKTTFPMGSMTGAPKIKAMELIENYEVSKRGLYSGAVGYFSPNGSMDFNVVIRSILYNATRKYLSFSVGSAITAKSVPEKEYEECLVKAKAMLEVLR